VIEVDICVALRSFTLEISASFAPGVTLLTGASGAGKSTLLRAIAGLVRPDRGRIALDGALLYGERIDVPAHRRSIGLVFQDYALFPHLDVLENIAYGIRGTSAARRAAAAAGLAAVGLTPLGAARPGALSGGERQRVALARALATQPRALLLDEPFAALDATTRTAARDLVREAVARLAVPVVLVTHDPADVAAFDGAKHIRIDAGKIVPERV
jgi:molybdate transport system ATP-binding protein